MSKLEISWEPLTAMEAPLHSLNVLLLQDIAASQRQWREILKPYFPRDPSEHDWSSFRPLRISREEDWSNWLAYLLESSSSHLLAKSIFDGIGVPDADLKPRVIEREVQAGRYRADLYIEWEDSYQTHVEVKVGDRELAKTKETGIALRREKHGDQTRWSDCILLLEEQKADWHDLPEKLRMDVHVITWHDVAKAFRKVLAKPQVESTFWISWAIAFSGCIEQSLLGLCPNIAGNYYAQNVTRRKLLQMGNT